MYSYADAPINHQRRHGFDLAMDASQILRIAQKGVSTAMQVADVVLIYYWAYRVISAAAIQNTAVAKYNEIVETTTVGDVMQKRFIAFKAYSDLLDIYYTTRFASTSVR